MTTPPAAGSTHLPPIDDTDHGLQPVPPDNRPGHRPEVDQDKPSLADLHRASLRAETAAGHHFTFRFDPHLRALALLALVHPGSAGIDVDADGLTVRFGRWTLTSPVENIAEVRATGPYRWWKVAGPPHLSLADGGITFATSTARGVCVRFHEPVPAALPTSLLRHGAVTVTPEDVDGLIAALDRARAATAPRGRQR
jgi:hypothetical protein